MNIFDNGSSTIAFITILTYTFSLLYIASFDNRMNNMYYYNGTTNKPVNRMRRRDMKVRDAIQSINNPVMYNFLLLTIMQTIVDRELSMGTIRKLTTNTANNVANTSIITSRKRIGIGINNVLYNIDSSDDRQRILADILLVLDYYDRIMSGNSKFMSTSKAVRHKVNATVIRAA